MMPDLKFRPYIRYYKPFIIESCGVQSYFMIIDQEYITLQNQLGDLKHILIKELYKIKECSLKAPIYKFLHNI